MSERENENSLQVWFKLGVESAKLAGEIATKAVKLGLGSSEYDDPPVKLWSRTNEKLSEDLRELGLTDEEIERHQRFERQVQPKLKDSLFKLGD